MSTSEPVDLTKRERVALVLSSLSLIFAYPLLLVWHAHGELDHMYLDARPLPQMLRNDGLGSGTCATNALAFGDAVKQTARWCGVALPTYGPMKSVKALRAVEGYLPLLGRSFVLWHELGQVCQMLTPLWDDPVGECPVAADKLHAAAARLDAALASYAEIRMLLKLLIYLWAAAQLVGLLVFVRMALAVRRLSRAASSTPQPPADSAET